MSRTLCFGFDGRSISPSSPTPMMLLSTLNSLQITTSGKSQSLTLRGWAREELVSKTSQFCHRSVTIGL